MLLNLLQRQPNQINITVDRSREVVEMEKKAY
jgi:hypothetical protein